MKATSWEVSTKTLLVKVHCLGLAQTIGISLEYIGISKFLPYILQWRVINPFPFLRSQLTPPHKIISVQIFLLLPIQTIKQLRLFQPRIFILSGG